MKRNIVNFTRGSQLLRHFGFMFASGPKAPVIIAAIHLVGISYWMVTSGLTDHPRYLAGMNLYASLYGFMEFDPTKPVNLDLAGGASVRWRFRRSRISLWSCEQWKYYGLHFARFWSSPLCPSLCSAVPARCS